MLTDNELRQAVFALNVIDERGDEDEFAFIMSQARKNTPCLNDSQHMSTNQNFSVSRMANKLVSFFGEPHVRCREAATWVNGVSRQRMTFEAIIKYAAELTGTCELGENKSVKARPRVAVRIVREETTCVKN